MNTDLDVESQHPQEAQPRVKKHWLDDDSMSTCCAAPANGELPKWLIPIVVINFLLTMLLVLLVILVAVAFR